MDELCDSLSEYYELENAPEFHENPRHLSTDQRDWSWSLIAENDRDMHAYRRMDAGGINL